MGEYCPVGENIFESDQDYGVERRWEKRSERVDNLERSPDHVTVVTPNWTTITMSLFSSILSEPKPLANGFSDAQIRGEEPTILWSSFLISVFIQVSCAKSATMAWWTHRKKKTTHFTVTFEIWNVDSGETYSTSEVWYNSQSETIYLLNLRSKQAHFRAVAKLTISSAPADRPLTALKASNY